MELASENEILSLCRLFGVASVRSEALYFMHNVIVFDSPLFYSGIHITTVIYVVTSKMAYPILLTGLFYSCRFNISVILLTPSIMETNSTQIILYIGK